MSLHPLTNFEIQKCCENENNLITDIKTVKAAELKTKLGLNQVDPRMSQQESIGVRLRKTFLGEEIFEDFSTLNCLIDFYFPKYKLAVESDKLDDADRDSVKENKRQTEIAKYLDCKFITINPDKKILVIMMGLVKYLNFLMSLKKEK